ncbi:MAG TPA: DUF3800 domain-containing protein [Mycobacteriales bacterium]|nr:DUF3800 domain-containing protein [Mycobacteriales bacterium]
MARTSSDDAIDLPLRYPTSLIHVDESGSRASREQFFVVGAVKVRESGQLARTIRDVRDRNNFEGEFRFSTISRGKLAVYYDLIDQLEQSDAHFAACVVDRSTGADPFASSVPPWRIHARVTAQLLRACINRREVVSVLLDSISTPKGCALDDTVRGMVNTQLGRTAVVTAACLNSRTNDGLQVADLVASAIAFDRRKGCLTKDKHPNSHKAKVAARLATAFGISSFDDVHTERVNIATYRRRAPVRLATVEKIPRLTG